jgi:dethiobiotin synthetase
MHLFITGTDTDVGKTWVTASLAKHYLGVGKTVAIYKPVQTGVSCFEEGDAYACAELLGHPEALHVETTYSFTPPAAPSMIEGHGIISFEVIRARFLELEASYDVVLVEGAGGLMCPIKDDLFMVDLAKMLDLPCLLVTRYNLGTLNHTLLSVERLRQRGVILESLVVKEAHPLSTLERQSLAVRGVVEELKRLLPDVTIREEAFTHYLCAMALNENSSPLF